MTDFNWSILLLAALIPVIVGSIYYHPKCFGSMWKRISGVSSEKMTSRQVISLIGLSYLLGLIMASTIMGLVVHQLSIYAIFEGSPGYLETGSDLQKYLTDFMSDYGNNHRNFRHGAIHGGWTAISFALPLIAIVGMLERRGWKYIGVHFGYWFLTLILMGGLICHFL